MPTNTSFQDEHLPQVMALYNEKLSLRPKRIKERVIMAHHLEVLEKLQLFQSQPLSFLTKVLADNWHKYKLSLCGYTAHPESDVTLLLCDIAHTLGKITGEKPIHLLMPGVSTESILDGVPSLEEMDLKTVLKTHIVSDSGNYLYPVAALDSLACESDLSSQKIPNPYYDFNFATENDEDEGYIPAAALERMLNHSLDTQAILDAKARYQQMINPTNLLGQLQMLIKTLRMNSKSGIGSEEQAGSRTYAGIISFNDYYQTLSNEHKSLIPKDLKDEIEFLLALSGSKEQNDEGTQTLQTCTNIRQDKLATLTKQHEPILINIGVDEQAQSELIKAAREDFVLLQNQIQAKCTQGAYHGEDKLTLSKKLVDTLNVPVEIRSRSELRDFISLTAKDIESLLENNEALQEQLAKRMAHFDDLILFSTHTPIPQMEKVLHFVANKLPQPTARELSYWLSIQFLNRFEVVFKVYQNTVIENSINFSETLEFLSVEKRDMIFNTFEHVLPSLIQTSSDFYYTLMYLSEAQRIKMYEAVKHKIPSMIQNSRDLPTMLQLLSFEQQEAVYEVIKDRIPSLVRNTDDLCMVLTFANERQCTEVRDALKSMLPELIISCADVNVLLSVLKVENRAIIFDEIKDRLPEMIKTANDVACVFELINHAQSIIIFEKIKEKLPELIKSSRDVSRMLRLLNVDQAYMMEDALKSKLPNVILKAQDIQHACRSLDVAKTTLVLQLLPEKWTQNAKDVGLVFRALDIDEQRYAFAEMIKEKLPSLIQSANDIPLLCRYLSDQQSGYVLGLMIEEIPSLIKSIDDYVLVCEYIDEMDEEKLKLVYKPLKEKIVSVINTSEELGKMMRISYPDLADGQYNELFDMVNDKLTNLLKSSIDVGSFLKFAAVNDRSALLGAIMDRLVNIFNTATGSDVLPIVFLLDLEQNPDVLTTIVPRLIQSSESFYKVFEHLNKEQRKVLFAAMKERLPSLINNADDAGCVLKDLDAEQFAIILDAINVQLPGLFKTVQDVKNLSLDDEKRAMIIAALEKAQASELAANAPTFLPHKRLIEGNEPAKRQKRVGHREMDFLRHNLTLAQPRERKRAENEAKRQRI